MEDALISLKGLAILTGAGLIHAGQKKEGTNSNYTVSAHSTVQVEATEAGKVTIKTDAPIDPNRALYIMKLDPNGEMSGVPVKLTEGIGPRGTDGSVTLTSNLIFANDIIFVDFYQLYEEDAVQIDITPDQFGGYFYLEGSTLFKRELDGKDLPAEIIIPKVKIQSNFTFTLASSGDPSTFTFTMDAFPDYAEHDKTKKVLCSIQVLNADDNYDGGEAEDMEYNYARVPYDKDNEGAYFAKVFNETEKQTDNDGEGAVDFKVTDVKAIVLMPQELEVGTNKLLIKALLEDGRKVTVPASMITSLNVTGDGASLVTVNNDKTITIADNDGEEVKITATVNGKTDDCDFTLKKN